MKIDLTISSKLAFEIGLNESIILHKFVDLLETDGTEIDGIRWVEQSYDKWQEIFPFWSASTIKRAITTLQKKGFILIEQHGKRRYDRTNWYALCEENYSELFSSNEEIEIEKEEEDPNSNVNEEVEHKVETVKNHLKKLRFFPLRTEQLAELTKICRSHPLEDILAALDQTAAKNIFAWKYAYKVLLTNGRNLANSTTKWKSRNIIRTEKLPDWFTENEQATVSLTLADEGEFLEKKRRMEAIQMKYKQQEGAI